MAAATEQTPIVLSVLLRQLDLRLAQEELSQREPFPSPLPQEIKPRDVSGGKVLCSCMCSPPCSALLCTCFTCPELVIRALKETSGRGLLGVYFKIVQIFEIKQVPSRFEKQLKNKPSCKNTL